MDNIGKASVRVGILNGLPGINKEPTKYNFDISAWNWQSMQASPFFPPLLTEQITEEGGSFAALLPERRKFYVDNFLKGTQAYANAQAGDSEIPYIAFKPVENDKTGNSTPFLNELLSTGNFDTYELLQPDKYTNDNLKTYKGPIWKEALVPRILPPNDEATIKGWYAKVGATPSASQSLNQSPEDQKTLNYLNQSVVRDGLYWGVESSAFLIENMPFWVNVRVARTPPTSQHDTWFIISLGLDDNSNSFDIYFGLNRKTRIIDYYQGRKGGENGADTWQKEFSTDLAKMLDYQEEVEIGVMTCAGRLVVWANQVPMVYTRVDGGIDTGDNSGTLRECKIAAGKIRIYGSNVQARVNVCPMVFAPLSAVALAIPSVIQEDGEQIQIPYLGVNNVGGYEGAVCILPQQPDKKGTLYGVDCASFVGDSGTAAPDGVGMHKQGLIGFRKASSTSINTLPNADYYILYMQPQNVQVGNVNVQNGGAPYFFRIKGGAQRMAGGVGGGEEVSEDVISATESISAPDYFHALSTASVTLYNKGGKYDYLKNGQHGITVMWGWDGDLKQTFTGVIISATNSESAGMETITLQCEDYMHVLKNTPIINSPFYDGMVGYYAIKDLAERAGVISFKMDWDNEQDYFLPSGYSFTQPLMRFPAQQSIFDCMINIVQRFEAFVYFDPYGNFCISKLPGGLFSEESSGPNMPSFMRNSHAGDTSTIILDEKSIEYNFASTVNRISIWTLDRNTRASILYTKSAHGNEDNVVYRRVKLIDQAAYGDIEVARAYAERLGQRIFWPIKKAAFKALGNSDASILNIFDFVTIDGDEFRLMGVNRNYSADENSFTNEYNVEWLGGK